MGCILPLGAVAGCGLHRFFDGGAPNSTSAHAYKLDWHRGSGADPLIWRGLGVMRIAVISPPTALEGISDLAHDLMGNRPSAVGVGFRR
jgi:hypothetical protein